MSAKDYKTAIGQFVLYNAGGFSSYMLCVLLTWIFASVYHGYRSWHLVTALSVCFMYLFTFHYFITFKTNQKSLLRSSMGFVGMFIFFGILNVLLVEIAIKYLSLHYIVAITLVGGLLAIITYLLNKRIVFST